MCRVCDRVSKMAPEEGLKVVEAEIKRGRKPEHFKGALDKLLGTEVPEQDADRDLAFELSHRR